MTSPIITNIRIDDDRIVFELTDNREVSLPLSIAPGLGRATVIERQHWVIQSRGLSAHWPDIDADIAIWEVLGIPEEAYLRSLEVEPVS
jgi:hypothetical protein